MPTSDVLSESQPSTYVKDLGFNVFFDTSSTDRIHIASSDSRFTDSDGERPGIRLVVSSNPLSADYNPAVFNRIVRTFRDHPNLTLPDGFSEVPEKQRHIAHRLSVIVDHLREAQQKDGEP